MLEPGSGCQLNTQRPEDYNAISPMLTMLTTKGYAEFEPCWNEWHKTMKAQSPKIQKGIWQTLQANVVTLSRQLLRQQRGKEVVQWLLGADPSFLEFCKDVDPSSVSWIHCVAWLGWLDVLVEVITGGRVANVRATDLKGRSAVHYSIHRGSVQMTCALVTVGLAINTEDAKLHFITAARQGHTVMIDFLLEHIGDPSLHMNESEVYGHFAEAINRQDHVMLEGLLRARFRVDSCREGKPPLFHAARMGAIPLMKILLDHGAAARWQTRNDFTLLHQACTSNNPAVIDFVLANVNDPGMLESKTRVGSTPLDHAIVNEAYHSAIHLLCLGANPHTLDACDATILHTAAGYASPRFVELAIRHGLSVRDKDKLNRTPLQHAVEKSNWRTIVALKKAGASVYVTDANGETPLDIIMVTQSEPKLELLNVLLFGTEELKISKLSLGEGASDRYKRLIEALIIYVQPTRESGMEMELTLFQCLEVLDILLGAGASLKHITTQPFEAAGNLHLCAKQRIQAFSRSYSMFLAMKLLYLCWTGRGHLNSALGVTKSSYLMHCCLKNITVLPWNLQMKILGVALFF